jgi:hypothetical protein
MHLLPTFSGRILFCLSGCGNGARVSAKRGDFDVHVWIERKRLQDGVQLIVAVYLEDADIRESTYNAPEMLPLPGCLKRCRTLVLELPKPLHRLSVNMCRNPDFDLDMKEHQNISFLDQALKTRQWWSSTLGVSATDAKAPPTKCQRPGCAR